MAEVFYEYLGTYYTDQLQIAMDTFVASYNSPASKTTQVNRVAPFFEFLAYDDSQENLRRFCMGYDGRELNITQSELHVLFTGLVSDWRLQLQQCLTLDNRTKNSNAAAVRVFIKACETQGIMPRGTHRHATRFSYDKYKVGEGHTLLDNNLNEQSSTDNAEDVLSELDEDDQKAAIKLTNNILKENVKKNVDMFEQAITTLDRRIKLLREHFVAVITDFEKLEALKEKWDRDKSLLQRAKQLKELMELGPNDIGANEKGMAYNTILGTDPLSVAYVLYSQVLKSPLNDDQYYGLIRNQLKKSDIDINSLREAVNGSMRLLSAVHSLICLNVAGNSSPVRFLELNSLLKVSESTYVLSMIKKRKGEEHEVEPIPLSTTQKEDKQVIWAFNVAKSATRSIRKTCAAEYSKYLLVNRFKNVSAKYYPEQNNYEHHDLDLLDYGATVPSDRTFLQHFKETCLTLSDNAWEATPKSLRGSVLLLSAMTTRDAFDLQTKGRWQSMSMAEKYTRHMPEYMRRDSNLRDFLSWFETLLTINIEGFAEKIGIDADEYEQRKTVIINEQFGGIHCTDPRAGVQPGTIPGDVCTKVEKCVTCSNRRNFFLATIENFASLMQLHESLNEGASILSEDEFEKWRMWHVFTELTLARFNKQREHRRLLDKATELALNTENHYRSLVIPSVTL